ncbi:MAG: aminoacyl-tRNA hydrolase [Aureliella sp.]
MKIIVGLGNPGRKYENTRHNVGFEVVETLCKRLAVPPGTTKFEGEFTTTQFDEQKLTLVRPLTFMNLSGRCVAGFINFYKVDPTVDLLVVCDDLSMPTGKLRFRSKGSSGGQNGLKDIIKALGTEAFCRLKFGIGNPPPRWDTADYVLGKFRTDERELVDQVLKEACDAIECWVKHDINVCMNRFN